MPRVVDTTVSINDQRKFSMANKIVSAFDGDVQGKKIAILGLTFKPNTDDVRDAPSIDIIAGLTKFGAHISAYDPKGMDAARNIMSGVNYASDAYDTANGADELVLVTE